MIKNLRCVGSAMLLARTVGWKGVQAQVLKKLTLSNVFTTFLTD